MKKKIYKEIFSLLCLALCFCIFTLCPLTVNAAQYTGKLKIVGTMQVGSTITAELVDSNYSGDLTYSWGFDYGLVSIGMEGYHQKTYKLQEQDFNRYIACSAKTADGVTFQSSWYYLVKGGSFDSSSSPAVKVPDAPSNVKTTVGDGQVTLTWDSVNNATKYGVFFYQNSSVTEIDSTTNTSYTVTGLTNGKKYGFIVRAYNSAGWSDWVWVMAVYATPKASDTVIITQQPYDQLVNAGQNVTFAVTATGANMNYQWQVSRDGTNWTDLSGKTSSSLSFTASSSDSLNRYRCVIKNSNSQAISNTAKLIVNSSLNINLQPTNAYAEEGKTATFRITAVGNGLTYQWQKSTNYGSSWTDCDYTGAKTDVLTITTKFALNNSQYRCVVKNSNGESLISNAATLTVGMVYPYFTTQPGDVSTTDGSTVKFSVAAYGVDLSYQWQKSTDGGNTWSNCSVTGATTANLSMMAAYTDDNSKVRCVVTAANGTKLTSNAATLTVSLAMPVVTSVSNTANGVEVKWNAVNGAAQYRVFYKTANGEWTGAGNTTGTSKVVTGLTSGTTYSFSVRCVSADGNTYTSSYDTTGKSIVYQPVITMVASPEITSLTNTSTGVQVKWNAVSGAAQYRVFYRIGSGAWTTVGSTTGTSKGVTGLTSGNTYTFLVRCLSADGKAYTSEYDVTKGKNITYIAQPAVSTVSNTSNGVEVRWNAIAGASQYRVFYKTANGAWTGFANTTGTSKVVTGLTSGTTYSFTVRCVSADGKTYTSTYDTIGKSIKYQPVAGTMYASPEILSLNNTTDGVEVKWDAIAGAAQYRIFYRVGSGAWTTVGATTGTTKVVSGLTSGTTYSFLVRCLSADGKAYTSEYDATKSKSITYKPTTLATPVVSSLSNTATGVQVKWNAVAGASQYRVFYKAGNGSWVGYGNTTGTDMVVTGLTKGTTYSFTVRCLSADGKSYTSNYDTTGKAISVQ